ncbi:MAG: ATP-binding cassette domain-containing protein, partial [Clostridia bacterium]|nr:ATP-binding cassette domain-containing protein [Clostridia bacterium]
DITADDFTEDDVFSVRAKIGMVFQNPDNQLVATVVEEDVAFGPENLGLPREEIRARVDDALRVVGMTEYAHHAPHKLSGGQKQRVAIAGIIAMKPRVIIFDESTAMLDPQGRQDVLKIMEALNKEEGITVLNITHYMDEAARADRVVVINDGKVLFDDTPKAVFSNVERLHEVGLEAPQGRELIWQLMESGVDICSDAISEDECVSALLEILK